MPELKLEKGHIYQVSWANDEDSPQMVFVDALEGDPDPEDPGRMLEEQ